MERSAKDAGLGDLNALKKKIEEEAAERDAKLRKSIRDMIDVLVASGLALLSGYVVKRGVLKREGPPWAAYGFGKIAASLAFERAKKSAAEIRESVEEALDIEEAEIKLKDGDA